MGGRLLFFLPAWDQITSNQFGLKAVRQGYSLPFVNNLPLGIAPVETPLPRLQFKQQSPWKEVASLLIKGSIETVDMSRDWGGGWLTCFLVFYFSHSSFHYSQSQRTHLSLCPTWRYSPLLCRVFTKIGASKPICMCRYTPVTGSIDTARGWLRQKRSFMWPRACWT